MSSAKTENLRVQISEDRLLAELIVPHHLAMQRITADTVRPVLDQAGIEWTDEVSQQVTQLLGQQRVPGKPLVGVIARGKPPKPGQDAQLTWTIDTEHEQQIEQSGSHYDRSAFITVASGQLLGRVQPATPGQPGRDVTGKPIPAAPGKPISLKLDETIVHLDDGSITAAAAGLLVRNDRSALIQQVLTIDDDVDFSTGNIDFEGCVLIRRGVKDRFIVKATQDIEINGLVEAAVIACGGNLVLTGGFAGREQGVAEVGGNLQARYLDGITADVHGNLTVTREVINCRLTVHGNAEVTSGTLVGGLLVVAGSLNTANLGSGGGVQTRIVLGSVPRLDPMHEQLQQVCDEYLRTRNVLEKQIKVLTELSDKEGLKEAHVRRLVQMQGELEMLRPQYDRACQARDALRRRLDALRVVDARIARRLNDGVVFEYQGTSYRIRNIRNGPLRICLDPDGIPIYETSAGGGPLGEIAEVLLPREPAAAA